MEDSGGGAELLFERGGELGRAMKGVGVRLKEGAGGKFGEAVEKPGGGGEKSEGELGGARENVSVALGETAEEPERPDEEEDAVAIAGAEEGETGEGESGGAENRLRNEAALEAGHP